MPPIRALFCDLDNTLTQDSRGVRLSAERVFQMLMKDYPHLEIERVYPIYRRINNWHWGHFHESPISQYDDPINPRIVIWREFLEEIGCMNGKSIERFAIAFNQAREETYQCYEDSIPVLEKMAGRIPLYMITNGHSQIQRKKIEVCGVQSYFDSILVAQEAGVSKPDPEIFRQALDAANISPENALMLGDNVEKDILGGKGAGMQTAWMRREDRNWGDENPNPDYTVQSMKEVWEILERSKS